MENINFNSAATIQAKAGDSSAKVSIVAYTGGIITVGGWPQDVVIDLNGLQLSDKVPLLLDHQESISATLGQGRPEVVGGRLLLEGLISRNTDAGLQLLNLNAAKVDFQASVGVRPSRVEQVAAGESVIVNGKTFKAGRRGLAVVRAGTLREISIVTFGADSSTAVSIAASRKKEFQTMDPTEQFLEQLGSGGGDVVAKERERVKQINALCDGNWGESSSTVSTLRAKAIDEEISVDELKSRLLDTLRASRPKAPGGIGDNNRGDITAKHLSAALLVKAGAVDTAVKSYGQDIVDQADQMGLKSIRDISAAALQMDGRDVPRSEQELIRASSSTYSLPTALGDSMNKQLLQFYRETPATWEKFSAMRQADDFHDKKSIRPSWGGELEKVGADGKLKHGELDESVFNWSVSTFGRMFGFSRRDMVNDSLGLIQETLPMMAQAAKRKFSDLVWGQIIDNSAAFFTSGNGNYGTTDSALSLTTLETAVTAMMTQRDNYGNDLDILPKYLAVSPELMVTAKQILESIEIHAAEGDPVGNALRNVTELIVEPRISNTTKFTNASTTQWFLFAEKSSIPVLAGTSSMTPAPVVEVDDAPFDTLGQQVRVYQDIGAALGDYRAAYRATGAGGGE